MTASEKDFFIAGVGASAGGLDALERFFSAAPKDTNLAYVVVQHLSPDYKSLMDEILAKRTDMPVRVATDGMIVEPNNVYLIPPKKSITIVERELHLAKREGGTLYLPIDIFFESLAKNVGEKAIAVVLSGTGSDGTRGVRAVKEMGGLVLVQDEVTAKFDGMPRSAMGTNLVDYVLPPEKMVQEIMNYIQHPLMARVNKVFDSVAPDEDSLHKIFTLLRDVSGVDFTYYKHSTMLRRIERRMGIKQVNKLSDYLYLLHQDTLEVNTLYRDFLIGVTRFFRDAEEFEIIKNEVIPALFENKERGETLRIWVAGCSTGEEAYSLAILLSEYMETHSHRLDVKVFATDIDRRALDFAGKGAYSESIVADMPPDYLKVYFIHKGDHYVVSRRIREMVVFAKQNLIIDPPFSKVDLISCRNVLIYLQPVLQKKVFASFQFALRDDAYLFLGSSETLGEADNYFHSLHPRSKIFQYKGGFRPSLETNRLVHRSMLSSRGVIAPFRGAQNTWRSESNLQSAIIESFLPPTIIVDEDMDIVYLSGDVDDYLRVPRSGMFSAGILKQAREGLSVPLSTAIRKVLKDGNEVIYAGIYVGKKQDTVVDLRAILYKEPGTKVPLVLLQLTPGKNKDEQTVPVESYNLSRSAQQRIDDLEYELRHTRESLQATVEELETSNEELQATNEELFAANEELQSTNEEMQSVNEELQSVNEELLTVNAEYHVKIKELTEVNQDINNLLSSTHIGTIFLDRKLCVRLFTPSAQHDVRLLDKDIGRPISHVTHNLVNCDLFAECEKVLETLVTHEAEVANHQGRWYKIRILPYYTVDHQVGGVVISLVDITDLKKANEELARLSAAFDNSAQLKMIVSEQGTIEYVNPRALEASGLEKEALVGNLWSKLFVTSENTALVPEIKRTLLEHGTWTGDLRYFAANHEKRWATVSVLPIYDNNREYVAGLITVADVHERKQTELELRKLSRVLLRGQISVIMTDAKGDIEYVNPEFTRVTGYELEDVLGKNPRFLKYDDYSKIDYKKLWSQITADEVWRGTFKNKKKNGEAYWAAAIISAIKDQNDKTVNYVAVQDDITELRLVETALSTLLDTLPFGITIADQEGKIIDVNSAAEEMLGVSVVEQKERDIDGTEWKIIRPDKTIMPSSEYASVRALKENKVVENVDMGIVKKDNLITWIRVSATPFAQGVVVFYYPLDETAVNSKRE